MAILHVVDSTAASEALEMLAEMMLRPDVFGGQRVLALGHQEVAARLRRAGVLSENVQWQRAGAWGFLPGPAAWLAVRRAVKMWQPTHIHAWGNRAAVAATMLAGFAGRRMGTLASIEGPRQLRLLRILTAQASWMWIGTSSTVVRDLVRGGIPAERAVRIRPGVPLGAASNRRDRDLRRRLGLAEEDSPVILLGGEGAAARLDHGLWASAIIQQLYPRTKVILRETSGGGLPARIREFVGMLPNTEMVVEAPAEFTWRTLASAADILLVTPERSTATGSILAAMACGAVVVGTAVECVAELVEHGSTGFLARAETGLEAVGGRKSAGGGPKALAARLEELLSTDPAVRWKLADNARAQIYQHFGIARMVEEMRGLYQRA